MRWWTLCAAHGHHVGWGGGCGGDGDGRRQLALCVAVQMVVRVAALGVAGYRRHQQPAAVWGDDVGIHTAGSGQWFA